MHALFPVIDACCTDIFLIYLLCLFFNGSIFVYLIKQKLKSIRLFQMDEKIKCIFKRFEKRTSIARPSTRKPKAKLWSSKGTLSKTQSIMMKHLTPAVMVESIRIIFAYAPFKTFAFLFFTLLIVLVLRYARYVNSVQKCTLICRPSCKLVISSPLRGQ